MVARDGSRFIKKNSSQYGPYSLASFHAGAVTRICRISGTHKWRPHPGLFSPREPSQERSSRRLLEDLTKSFTTFNCLVRMGVLRHLQSTSPLKFRRLLVRDWLLATVAFKRFWLLGEG